MIPERAMWTAEALDGEGLVKGYLNVRIVDNEPEHSICTRWDEWILVNPSTLQPVKVKVRIEEVHDSLMATKTLMVYCPNCGKRITMTQVSYNTPVKWREMLQGDREYCHKCGIGLDFLESTCEGEHRS